MTIRTAFLFLLLAAASIAGSGCSRTLVASLPVGTTTTCDPAWPGRWKAIPPEDRKAKHGEKAWLEINADCSVLTSIDEHGKREREDHKLTLIATRAGDFLWIADGDRKPDCIGEGTGHCGVELMRYVHDGNEIRLYNADHGIVHAAIAGNRVAGYAEIPDDKPSQGSEKVRYSNLIAGSPEEITTILEQHPEFFESVPWMTLQRDNHPRRKKHR